MLFLYIIGHQASLRYTYAKESHNAHIAVIKRNVKNLLKIAKRDAWLCDKNPTANGKLSQFPVLFPKLLSYFLNNNEITNTILGGLCNESIMKLN